MEKTVSGKRSKKERRQYSEQYKKEAVARMQDCESVVGLARELGICWSLLYRWKERILSGGAGQGAEPRGQLRTLRKEVTALKLALGSKTLEADFFRSALQKVETRGQGTGGVASTTKSGK